jgi:hypothetical protein
VCLLVLVTGLVFIGPFDAVVEDLVFGWRSWVLFVEAVDYSDEFAHVLDGEV